MTNEPSLGSYATRNADRLEDLAFMASHGETPAGAARRLGISVDTLERWCHRHDRRA